MPAVQSVLNNSSLCDAICEFSPLWPLRKRMKDMVEAMRVWATDEKLRLLHLFVHVVHQEQYLALTRSPTGSALTSRMVGFTRYHFSRELHGENDQYPFYLPDEDAWYVDIPLSIMSVAQATLSDLNRYARLLGLYGMKSRAGLTDDGAYYRLVIGRSSFGSTIVGCYDRIPVSTRWIDFTNHLDPNKLDRFHSISGIHWFGDLVDLCRAGLDGERGPGLGVSPPTSASRDYDRGPLGSILYGCSNSGLGLFTSSMTPFLYAALLLDPAFMGMMHLVFTPIRRYESDYLFSIKTHRVAELCESYRKEGLDSTNRALYEMDDPWMDRVLPVRCWRLHPDECGHHVGLDVRCSPAMQVIMATLAHRLEDIDMSHVTFQNYLRVLLNESLMRYRPGWTETKKDLADAMSYLVGTGYFTLVDFMTYRSTVHAEGFERDNQLVMMSSNCFMIELIGHCYPLAMFPSFSGRTVNPHLTYFVPFPYVKSDEERKVYSFPESISHSGAHMRYKYYEGSRDVTFLMDLVMRDHGKSKTSCTYDLRCPVTFARVFEAGDPTLRDFAPKGKDLLDVYCGAPLVGKKRVYSG